MSSGRKEDTRLQTSRNRSLKLFKAYETSLNKSKIQKNDEKFLKDGGTFLNSIF